jgi:Cu-processing system permease protein
MKTLLIARLTILEAQKKRLIWIIVGLSLLFLGVYAIGFFYMHRDLVQQMKLGTHDFFQMSNTLLMMGLYVVNFLLAVMSILLSVDTISGELASGTLHTIVTKPLRRWEVVLGKWLGLAIIIVAFGALLSLGLAGIVWAIADYVPPNLARGVSLMLLGGLVVLSLSVALGTRLATMANGVIMFMLYGLAFIAGWIEMVGAMANSAPAVNIGIVASLVMPSEAVWKRAAYFMQPAFLREFGMSPFSTPSAPSRAMIVYAVLYGVVVLALGVRAFNRRDL